jgi:hypothetical protein
MLRRDDDAHGAALHDLVERLRLGVALGVVHAAAHVRVEAEEMMAHQDLTFAGRAERLLDEAEVLGAGLAGRARDEVDLTVDLCHVDSFSRMR